jgi:hypothetical protein
MNRFAKLFTSAPRNAVKAFRETPRNAVKAFRETVQRAPRERFPRELRG